MICDYRAYAVEGLLNFRILYVPKCMYATQLYMYLVRKLVYSYNNYFIQQTYEIQHIYYEQNNKKFGSLYIDNFVVKHWLNKAWELQNKLC